MPVSDHRQQAFVTALSHAGGPLKASILAMVRDWDRAEEIYQEVCLTLWQRFDDYEEERSFIAWARGIARHKICHDFERRQRQPLRLSDAAMDAVEAAFAQREGDAQEEHRLEALHACLKTLSEQARRLLRWRYDERLPHELLAERAGTTVQAVTKTVSRLRSDLGDCIRRRLALDQP